MHLISFDASPRQISKLRNGHKVRIKRGSGFNLVVNPSNYNTISRAFRNSKGVELKLSPEELDINQALTPDQHNEMEQAMNKELFEHLPFEGGSIFKRAKKASKSKAGKEIRKSLKPAGREFLKAGQEMGHQRLAEAHMNAATNIENEHLRNALNSLASSGHEAIHNVGRSNIDGGALHKILGTKRAKAVRKALKPAGRAFKNYAQDIGHQQLADLHMAGAEYIPDNPNAQMGYNLLALAGHDAIGYNRNPYAMYGNGLGAGFSVGCGMNSHEALKLANLATANANHQLAKMHNAAVHGQITQPTIKRYWNEPLEPISRGTGVRGDLNFIRGRGSLLGQDDFLPPALQSQPYGANFHMQFQLPPEYKQYHDGTELEGRGLYV